MTTTPAPCPDRTRPDLPERLVTAALTLGATARVVRLVSKDDFPFSRLRDWSANRYGEDGWLPRLLDCPWCVGVWVAAPATLTALRWGHRPWWRALAAWMALSMAASSTVVLTHSDGPDIVVIPHAGEHGDQDGGEHGDGDPDGQDGDTASAAH